MEVQDEGGQSALHQPQDLFLMQETEVDSKTWLCAPPNQSANLYVNLIEGILSDFRDDTHLKCNACKLWKPKSTLDIPYIQQRASIVINGQPIFQAMWWSQEICH
jgi:hypothetical protein